MAKGKTYSMEKLRKNKFEEMNYWPHAIVIGIILIIIACAVTIKIALDNPVQMDSYYMDKYQNVDRNINEIMEKQQIFEESYAMQYATQKFTVGEKNSFEFSILDKNANTNVSEAQITLMVTRPETNEFNQEFILDKASSGVFKVDGIMADKPGRWQILTKVKIGDKSSFNRYEVYASK